MSMAPYEKELLTAIHKVEKKVDILETKIDDSVNGRFKDNERRIDQLEKNQRWVVLAVIGSVLTALLNIVLK